MAIEVTIHPPMVRLLKILAVTVGAVLLIMLPIRFLGGGGASEVNGQSGQTGPRTVAPVAEASHPPLLIPSLVLKVADRSLESHWIRALEAMLDGRREVPVKQGRVDVVTDTFAIEVDRVANWHTGIGQAVHYASETGRRPMVALFWPHEEWPPDRATILTILMADKICEEQRIKLLLLRPDRAESEPNGGK